MSTFIKPTIGRVVWYHPPGSMPTEQPQAAIVAHVHSDELVNLGVFNSSGVAIPALRVPLVQDGGTAPPDAQWCEWMPYQKGQAAKSEALEQQAAAATAG